MSGRNTLVPCFFASAAHASIRGARGATRPTLTLAFGAKHNLTASSPVRHVIEGL